MRAHSLRSVFFLLPCTVLFLCLLFSPSSLAAEGVEITESCVFTQSGKTLKEAPKMLDRDYRTYAFIYTGKALEVDGQGQKLAASFSSSTTMASPARSRHRFTANGRPLRRAELISPNGTPCLREPQLSG